VVFWGESLDSVARHSFGEQGNKTKTRQRTRFILNNKNKNTDRSQKTEHFLFFSFFISLQRLMSQTIGFVLNNNKKHNLL